MSNISKLEFDALDISENNYLTWALDAQIYLDTKGNGDTIKEGNQTYDITNKSEKSSYFFITIFMKM